MIQTIRFTVLCGALFALVGSVSLSAAKAKKKSDEGASQVPAAKYDKDNNGLLDSQEKQALAKAFKEGKDGAIKIYDLNQDGELTMEEIGQISLKSDTPAAPRKDKKEKKRKPQQQ